MKYVFIMIALLIAVHGLAQKKGLSPIKSTQSQQGKTYAVVVGVSDYQDEDIPDLRFADKDALAFAGFLKSPAGGSLEEDHLKVLVNKQATQAQFAAALDWLWEVAEENDKAIIYFSGHGDVERKSLTQPGYLLCWDAPSKVYMAGGAFPLSMMQEIISTISIQNKAKVIMIVDACRSGKLSGNKVGGAQLTNSNLAKQYANEIKILSCQPNEYSIEGEQWGGGRGAFSYHLLEGLSGMADGNEDLTVNLLEIGRYLEDHVTTEVAPQSQIPMTVGSRTEKLTDVFPDILAQIKEGKKEQSQLFTATDSRGMEDEVLTGADTSVVEMYFAFKESITKKNFLEPADACADFYYNTLSTEPQLERLHSSMRRNYAAALQDDAQQVMNKWLKTDISELILSKISKTAKYQPYPHYLERAAKLLGSRHYMYSVLMARKLYFEGYLLSLRHNNPDKELGAAALEKFRGALLLQPNMPQTYLSMSRVFGYNMLQQDSMEHYAQLAADQAPSWVLPIIYMAFSFSDKYRQPDKSKYYLEKADQIDSNSIWVLNGWGLFYKKSRRYGKAEKYFNNAIQLDSTYTFAYNNLGNLYSDIQRYDESEKSYEKAIQLDSTFILAYNNLGIVYANTKRYDEAEKSYGKAIQLDSTYISTYINLGNLFSDTRRYKEAEKSYKKAIQFDSTFISAHINIANLFKSTRRYDEAEKSYKKAIHLDSTFIIAYNNLGIVYANTRRYDEAEKSYKKAIQLDSTFTNAYLNLGNVYIYTRRYDEAEKYFIKTIQLDSTLTIAYSNLGVVYQNTRRQKEAEKYFKKTTQLDSANWIAYANLGVLYQFFQQWEESKNATLKSIQLGPPIWELHAILGNAYTHLPDGMEDAKKELDQVVEMSPDSPDTYIYLAQWSIINNQQEEAWKYLEQGLGKGIENGELKFSNLQEGPDFTEMRKDVRWEKLMVKYFPEAHKN